jgi:ABC-2 type transport system ATP-binding protein
LYQFQRNTQTIFLEFSQEIQKDTLSALPGVQNIRKKGTGKYEIDTHGTIDIRPDIFKLAAENNWTLIGIKQEEKNLESIFQALTK